MNETNQSQLSAEKKWSVLLLGTGLGLGMAPVAPGSFAALLGVGFHFLYYFCLPRFLYIPLLVITFLAVCYLNHVLTPWAEEYWNKQDSGNFVLDEIAGYLMVPLFFHADTIWVSAPVGYVLFRVFDIVKIPPADYVDKNFHGPWGVLIDDLISGLYAVMFLYLGTYFHWFDWVKDFFNSFS